MSKTKDNRIIFEIKNRNRKKYFTACKDPEKLVARELRKSNNGAFGRSKAHDTKNYNKMIIGTSLGSKM
jgi:hypothetical protein